MLTAILKNKFISIYLAVWLKSPLIDCPVEDTVWQSILTDIWWTSNNKTSCPIDWHAKSMAV